MTHLYLTIAVLVVACVLFNFQLYKARKLSNYWYKVYKNVHAQLERSMELTSKVERAHDAALEVIEELQLKLKNETDGNRQVDPMLESLLARRTTKQRGPSSLGDIGEPCVTASIENQITVEYPGGFSEKVSSVIEAEERLRESSDTGVIEADPEDLGRYREHRECGPDGPGWYFAGRLYRS